MCIRDRVGVAGFALPGNHVDVMVNTQDDQQRPISKIVLERILVLAVAQEASRDETKPRVVSAVTLEVAPEEAEKLDLARSVGNLSLVLRNQVDRDQTPTAGMRKNDLLGQPVTVPVAAPIKPVSKAKPVVRRAPPAPKPDTDSVEVIRGVQRSVAQF